MNKAPIEIVTVCLIITAGFFLSERLSTGADHARLRSSQSAPTEIASIGPAPSIVQFIIGAVQLPEPAKVRYSRAEAPTETGLEWTFPKGPPLHLLDLHHSL
jgi:hypothetical protein